MTFALLFATCVLGWPLSAQVNHLLARLGVHWLYALILPAVLFLWLSKRETQLIPDERRRMLVARGMIAASLLVAILLAWWRR